MLLLSLQLAQICIQNIKAIVISQINAHSNIKAVILYKLPFSSPKFDWLLIEISWDYKVKSILFTYFSYFSMEHKVKRKITINVDISPQTVYFSKWIPFFSLMSSYTTHDMIQKHTILNRMRPSSLIKLVSCIVQISSIAWSFFEPQTSDYYC